MSIPRGRTILSSLAAVLVGIAGAAVPAGPALAATWSVVPTPNASTGTNMFVGVDATGTANAWAVGRADHAPNPPFVRPLVARWNGSTWSLATTPTLGGHLGGVDGSASNHAFAVGAADVSLGGGVFTSGPLIERWNGTSWSVVSSPTPSGSTSTTLSGVKTFSATSAWAVGEYFASSASNTRTLIQRWNGTSWSIVPSPSPDPRRNLLTDVDGAATGDVWAIGNQGDDGYGGTVAGLVLRWNGSTWSHVDVASAFADNVLSITQFSDVVAVSTTDVWIVGTGFHRGLFAMVPFSLRWNGQTWQRSLMTSAPNSGFSGVAAVSGRVYAVGGNRIARWTGTAWAAESATVPGTLLDAAGTGAATVWAVGYGARPNRAQPATLAVRTTNG